MTDYVSCRTAADAEIVRDAIWKRVWAALVGVGALGKGTGAFAVSGHSADPDGGGPTADLAEWSAAAQDAITGRWLVEMPTAWIDQEMGLGAALKASSGNPDAAFVGGGALDVWLVSSDIGHDVDFIRRGESISGREIAEHLRRKAVTRSQPSIRKDVLEVVER